MKAARSITTARLPLNSIPSQLHTSTTANLIARRPLQESALSPRYVWASAFHQKLTDNEARSSTIPREDRFRWAPAHRQEGDRVMVCTPHRSWWKLVDLLADVHSKDNSRKFLIDVDECLAELLEREDTDNNWQITIEDVGPKVLSLHQRGRSQR
jgi:hypothetical protein